MDLVGFYWPQLYEELIREEMVACKERGLLLLRFYVKQKKSEHRNSKFSFCLDG